MSKRSYRRLAVVAGAALAVGSMAPAMAARVNVGGTGSGSAGVNISDMSLPAADDLVDYDYLADVKGFAVDTVFGALELASENADGVNTDVYGIVSDLLDGTSNLAVNIHAGANANASSGSATVQVGGIVGGSGNLLGDLPGPGTVLAGAEGTLSPVRAFARQTVHGAVGLAHRAPGVVHRTGHGLLGLVDDADVEVTGRANIVAAVLASL